MSEVLTLSGTPSNFSFTQALVFDIGLPNSRWFRTTIGKDWVMAFYPDDNSISRELIAPGDTIYVAGIVANPKDGLCSKKANCAPLALQHSGFKQAVARRKEEATQLQVGCPIKRPEPTPEPTPEPEEQTFDDSNFTLKFNGMVKGKANVDFVEAKKEKYAARGRNRSMYAINEIVELARQHDT